MSLLPDLTQLIARARVDLRMGLPVVLTDAGVSLLVLAAEPLRDDWFEMVRSSAVVALTARRAETLKARVYDNDTARLFVPIGMGPDWVQAMADPASDLEHPMKGPFQSEREGSGVIHKIALDLVKSARLLPAAVITPVAAGAEFARDHNLTLLPATLLRNALEHHSNMVPVVSARLPVTVSDKGRLHIFRPDDGAQEHYAMEIGTPKRNEPVLVRLHSACFTGDVMGSMKCDCGPQLHAALQTMGQRGAGVLLYMNQEGRGIGLANKMRAYSLQDQGFDTVEANHRLGFEDDERDFRLGADILRKMGFDAVRLMTNNPAKIEIMEKLGIRVVERVPVIVGQNDVNRAYLETKARKSGHLL